MPSAQPAAVPHANHSIGLRTVAIFKAAEGALVLLAGFGVLALIDKNLDDRQNPLGAGVGCTGLCNGAARRGVRAVARAQWFALLSGALYLPGELYSLLRHPRPLKWAVLVVNAVIVLYMLVLRVRAQRIASESR